MSDAVVFTCLFGDYEDLMEQSVAPESVLPFICFTDNPELSSATWEIRVVQPALQLDPARSSRHPKILAHRHLPDHRRSLYIDNSVRLLKPPEELLDTALPDSGPPMALNAHSFHHTLEREAYAIAEHGFEDPHRLSETVAMLSDPRIDMMREQPLWGGMLARRHGDPRVIAAMEAWWTLVLRYSRRDQLTLPVALSAHGLTPGLIGLDNHRSEFHEWPAATGRASKRVAAPKRRHLGWVTAPRWRGRRARARSGAPD